jgi:type IV secretory pathway TraG/TraD family ATPase VirD4
VNRPTPRPDQQPGPPPTAMLLGLLGVLAVAGGLWVAVAAGATATGHPVPRNPIVLPLELASGARAWPGLVATLVAVTELLVAAALLVAGLRMATRLRGRRSRVDHTAQSLARPGELTGLTPRDAAARTARLAPTLSGGPETHGPLHGYTVTGNVALRSSWEDVKVVIAGPRVGKTSSQCIPEVVDAPGAVVATTNKRDLVDATRDVRADRGTVWIFDPNDILGEAPTWWWNPLAGMATITAARELVGHFVASSRAADARPDSFFDPEGEELLANYLLAGALSKMSLLDTGGWLYRPGDRTAVDVLERHGFTLSAAKLAGTLDYPDKQRAGILGVARKLLDVLAEPTVARWVNPPPDGAVDVPEFTAERFAATTDTLYLVSQEGPGSAAPLVAALTAAILDSAVADAGHSPGGRLPVPLVLDLDEAANVCRIRSLPDKYSFYGSMGIVITTVLQSYAQGVDAWGEAGIRKMWSAANVKIYLGGVSERKFLDDLSALIGDHRVQEISQTHGRGAQWSRSVGSRSERILDVADLAALPLGRALVFSSGNRPTLIRPVPWWDGPHAEGIRASMAAHGPGIEQPTLR